MAGITDLICKTADGKLSFGNFDLDSKQKRSDFPFEGDLYKVKTFKEITKLERNRMFVYESVPGTAVTELSVTEDGMTFQVEGTEDAEITLGLEEEKDYQVSVEGVSAGQMKTNLGGKLTISVELDPEKPVKVAVVRA